MTYYNVPKHERQRRTHNKMKRRLERVKDHWIPERKFESEALLDKIKVEVMTELGIPLWENEGYLPSRVVGEIGFKVRQRFDILREEIQCLKRN